MAVDQLRLQNYICKTILTAETCTT